MSIFEPRVGADEAPDSTSSGLASGKPAGIGGWLVIPAFGLVAGPVLILYQVGKFPSVLADVPPGYDVLRGFITLEIVANLVLFCLGLYAALNFFARKRSAPRAVIILLIAGVIVTFADSILAFGLFRLELDPRSLIDLARAIVVVVIWVPYFQRSKRVRNTFIR